jgi:uncharacterized membrane protein YGL010W
MILTSLPLMLGGFYARPLLWTGLALYIVGWALQFLGHAIEGRPPEFLKDWRFLLAVSRWWAAKVRKII